MTFNETLQSIADDAYAYGCGGPPDIERLAFAAGVEALALYLAGEDLPEDLHAKLARVLPELT